jgi:hypothetical protein
MLLALALACAPEQPASPDTGGDSGVDAVPVTDTDLEPGDPCFVHPPQLLVGTGAYAWEPIEGPLQMVRGPQGGWHLLGSVLVRGTDPVVTLTFTVELVEEGATVADNVYTVQLIEDGPCSGSFYGLYAYLDVSEVAQGELDTPPEVLANRAVRIHMTATDEAGRFAEHEQIVVVQRDPIDLPDTGAWR